MVKVLNTNKKQNVRIGIGHGRFRKLSFNLQVQSTFARNFNISY